MINKNIKRSIFLLSLFSLQVQSSESDPVSNVSYNDAIESCLLIPSQEIELSAPVTGIIEKFQLYAGDKVKKGDVVMQIDARVEQAVLDSANAKYGFAARKVKRNKTLYKNNLISENEKDTILTEQKLAALQIKEAKAKLKLKSIRSPIDGVVIERLLEPGEFIHENAFVKIASLDPIHAEIVLPAHEYGHFKINENVKISSITKNQFFDGKIKTVDPIIDAASNTFVIIVEISNTENQLISGERCKILFESSDV